MKAKVKVGDLALVEQNYLWDCVYDTGEIDYNFVINSPKHKRSHIVEVVDIEDSHWGYVSICVAVNVYDEEHNDTLVFYAWVVDRYVRPYVNPNIVVTTDVSYMESELSDEDKRIIKEYLNE